MGVRAGAAELLASAAVRSPVRPAVRAARGRAPAGRARSFRRSGPRWNGPSAAGCVRGCAGRCCSRCRRPRSRPPAPPFPGGPGRPVRPVPVRSRRGCRTGRCGGCVRTRGAAGPRARPSAGSRPAVPCRTGRPGRAGSWRAGACRPPNDTRQRVAQRPGEPLVLLAVERADVLDRQSGEHADAHDLAGELEQLDEEGSDRVAEAPRLRGTAGSGQLVEIVAQYVGLRLRTDDEAQVGQHLHQTVQGRLGLAQQTGQLRQRQRP